jgi:hypothetical protein
MDESSRHPASIEGTVLRSKLNHACSWIEFRVQVVHATRAVMT